MHKCITSAKRYFCKFLHEFGEFPQIPIPQTQDARLFFPSEFLFFSAVIGAAMKQEINNRNCPFHFYLLIMSNPALKQQLILNWKTGN